MVMFKSLKLNQFLAKLSSEWRFWQKRIFFSAKNKLLKGNCQKLTCDMCFGNLWFTKKSYLDLLLLNLEIKGSTTLQLYLIGKIRSAYFLFIPYRRAMVHDLHVESLTNARCVGYCLISLLMTSICSRVTWIASRCWDPHGAYATQNWNHSIKFWLS